jgi:hypothetical protein
MNLFKKGRGTTAEGGTGMGTAVRVAQMAEKAKGKAKVAAEKAKATGEQVQRQQNNYKPMLVPRVVGRRRSNYSPGAFIRVNIIEGKELPYCMNAHCIIHMDNVFQRKTRTVTGIGGTPKWNAELKVFDYGHGRDMRITFADKGIFLDDMMGEISIPMDSLRSMPNQVRKEWKPIRCRCEFVVLAHCL